MSHITVLLQEAVDSLQLRPDSVIVDATFGSGGHAREIVERLGSNGTFVGIDADVTAFAKQSFANQKATVHLVNDNFQNITNILSSLQIEKVDGILADLGWRMEQFTDSGKGFSFAVDEPLIMTFGDPSLYPFTVHDIVNEWEEETIANIIFGYADERYARRIARGIVERRRQSPIATTLDLADIVRGAVPKAERYRKIHPATKTFQALRIAVNDELGVLERFIKNGFRALAPGGIMSIITFHSIEDRIVKHTFRALAESEQGVLTPKKPLSPSVEELQINPRARSAKLRTITKTT